MYLCGPEDGLEVLDGGAAHVEDEGEAAVAAGGLGDGGEGAGDADDLRERRLLALRRGREDEHWAPLPVTAPCHLE